MLPLMDVNIKINAHNSLEIKKENKEMVMRIRWIEEMIMAQIKET